MLFILIRSWFIRGTKELTAKDCAIIIQSMGFTRNEYSGYSREYYDGYGIHQTRIEIKEKGVWIKSYAYGYGESDFLDFPIVGKGNLKKFIRENKA